MIVMKFGGASVKDAKSIQNATQIIKELGQKRLVLVVSAMDKTTNHLEDLASLSMSSKQKETENKLEEIQQFHYSMLEGLLPDRRKKIVQLFENYFKETRSLLRTIESLQEFRPFVYDKIVSYGELLSTSIVNAWMNQGGLNTQWMDARKFIKTDSSFSSANISWEQTETLIKEQFIPALDEGKICLTQGFIGSNFNDQTTTLGREGSDFTAAIIANCLDAQSVTVWKDVTGVFTEDPKENPLAEKFDQLSYHQAVEMTYFGSRVIHPKTIKPLFEKGIPLYVRSFNQPEISGTKIHSEESQRGLRSRITLKKRALIRVSNKGFSFINPLGMSRILGQAAQRNLRVLLFQKTSLTLTIITDDNPSAIRDFIQSLSGEWSGTYLSNLRLETIINPLSADLDMQEDLIFSQLEKKILFRIRDKK